MPTSTGTTKMSADFYSVLVTCAIILSVALIFVAISDVGDDDDTYDGYPY